ncbi:MAG: 23S rRNA (guanosine(2251)-2'-O)-methyltransferase RlmB [Thermovirgaceae bacterium]|nr:23S rRNA (guanosine(2251)-2'-O)-methyltransferase RlmB [Thermovirgaceae bacterium]
MKERPTDTPEGDNDLCFGKNSVRSALTSSPELCSKVLVAESLGGRERSELLDLCREAGIPWQSVRAAFLDNLCPGGRHQGVAAKMSPVRIRNFEDISGVLSKEKGPGLLLLLDHVQDPQNLGAIARSAEVFGAAALIVPKRRSALPTATVMRTSAGAIARIPVIGVVNVARTLKDLKELNYWIVGLHHEAPDKLGDRPMPERAVLVTGSEDKGLSRLTAKSCDLLLRIPMQGITGSLNAATAAAIGMYEWRRVIDNAVGHG